MVNEKNHRKEPLFHIAKRDQLPLWKSMLIRAIAILAGFLFCGIMCAVIVGKSPFKLYESMFDGVFGSSRRIWKMAKDLAVLLCISLGITPAFKMRFWNIGAEGQVLMSCLASVACIIYFGGKVPNSILLVIMFVAAVIIGAICPVHRWTVPR